MFGSPPEIFAKSWIEIIQLIVVFTGVMVALTQLEILRRQLKADQRKRDEENLKERRRRTLQIDSEIAKLETEREIIEAIFPQSIYKSTVALKDIQQKIETHKELKEQLRRIFAQFEVLSIPIFAQVADEDMAFELIGGSLVRYSNIFKEYIENKRKCEDRPDLYIYFTELGKKWDARLSKNEGPLYLPK
jgi:hypothetical protein